MDELLLIRFLTHTCTTGEIKRISDWLAADKANSNWLFEMERIWSLKKEIYYSDREEIENAYRRFITGLKQKEKKKAPVRKRFPLTIRFSSLLKYAIALFIVVALTVDLYVTSDTATAQPTVIEVPAGQRVSVRLSDGSRVWLNSESKLVYPTRFSSGHREVTLEGEAFFEVKHDKKSPFTIRTPFLSVRVLGTRFNMRTYPGEKQVITLTDGKVEIQTNDHTKSLILHPREQASYSAQTGITLTRNVQTDLAQAWIKGETAFIDKRLDEIVPVLERKYDIRISLADSLLAKEIFTCHFKETATLRQILDLLKATNKVDYSFTGNTVRLSQPPK
ncbi:MAG: FecR domain-containing protein [Parabacteroides sp.]|nr:FecR domain-containing protein [Parabacteroides sp.]